MQTPLTMSIEPKKVKVPFKGKVDQTVFGTKCPHGKPICEATAEWEFNQCSPCCCKGGEGFQNKFKTALTFVDDSKELRSLGVGDRFHCAPWFQTIDGVANVLVLLLTRITHIFTWVSRCAKF